MKLIKRLILSILVACLIIAIGYLFIQYLNYQQLIKEKPLEQVIETVQSKDDYVSYDDISFWLVQSVVSGEDKRFFDRSGLDFRALARSIFVNIKEQRFVQGGSTIPQQLAKVLYFDMNQSLDEKVQQVFFLYDLEAKYSKEEIFEIYINSIYLGQGYTGIYQASTGYFNVLPIELDLNESSLLAGLIPAPSVYNPVDNPEIAKEKQVYILQVLLDRDIITPQQFNEVIKKAPN